MPQMSLLAIGRLVRVLEGPALISQLTWVPTGLHLAYLKYRRERGETVDYRLYPAGDLFWLPPGTGEALGVSWFLYGRYRSRVVSRQAITELKIVEIPVLENQVAEIWEGARIAVERFRARTPEAGGRPTAEPVPRDRAGRFQRVIRPVLQPGQTVAEAELEYLARVSDLINQFAVDEIAENRQQFEITFRATGQTSLSPIDAEKIRLKAAFNAAWRVWVRLNIRTQEAGARTIAEVIAGGPQRVIRELAAAALEETAIEARAQVRNVAVAGRIVFRRVRVALVRGTQLTIRLLPYLIPLELGAMAIRGWQTRGEIALARAESDAMIATSLGYREAVRGDARAIAEEVAGLEGRQVPMTAADIRRELRRATSFGFRDSYYFDPIRFDRDVMDFLLWEFNRVSNLDFSGLGEGPRVGEIGTDGMDVDREFRELTESVDRLFGLLEGRNGTQAPLFGGQGDAIIRAESNRLAEMVTGPSRIIQSPQGESLVTIEPTGVTMAMPKRFKLQVANLGSGNYACTWMGELLSQGKQSPIRTFAKRMNSALTRIQKLPNISSTGLPAAIAAFISQTIVNPDDMVPPIPWD